VKILFLDIDGVLNTHEPLCPHAMSGQIHDDKAAMLKQILIDTGAKVVLSSAWRYLVHRGEMNLIGLNWLFRSHGLPAGAIIDITREDTLIQREPWDGSKPWPVTNERGQQIADWCRQNNFKGQYAVVDDLDLGISAAGHPFVQTEPQVGLTAVDARRLAGLLS
jgi:HAD domain in Swiss Army Knife RNA repair proteins